MAIEVTTEQELSVLQEKIEKARAWARDHFNAKQAGDTRLVDENFNLILAFFVEFPTPDTMRVSPSTLGTPGPFWIDYRLHFKKDGRIYWQGHNPFWNTPYPPLWVD